MPRIISAAVMAAAGASVFLLLPIIIGAAVDSLQWQQQRAGFLASSYFTGYFASCVAAVFLVRRFNLQILATAAYFCVCTGLLAAALTHEVVALSLCMLVSGWGAGLLFGLAVLIVGHGANSERGFGILLVSQQVTAMALLFVLPGYVVPQWGFGGLMVALGLFLATGILTVPWIGNSAADQRATRSVNEADRPSLSQPHRVWFGLSALALYFAALAGVWAFVERMGLDGGMSSQWISLSLSLSMLGGVVGGLMVAILADRFGRSRPILLSLAAFLGVFIAYSIDYAALTYAVATFVFSLFWNYVLGYQMVLIADLDQVGRYSVLIPAAQALGAVLGPGAAGFIIAGMGYLTLLLVAALTVSLTTGVFLLIVKAENARDDELSRHSQQTTV